MTTSGEGQHNRSWTRESLSAAGFVGWVPWSSCPEALAAIPQAAGGVYVVVRPDAALPPSFLAASTAGTFRGDPAVTGEALDANWVPGASVVYIGKADHGRLRIRLREYVAFGRGGNARHSGGRLIWQLAEAQQLLVAWRVLGHGELPLTVEGSMIAAFRADYGKPPFANDPHRLGR